MLPYCPPKDQFVQFIKHQSTVPVETSMKLTGKLIENYESRTDGTLNLLAHEIVHRENVTEVVEPRLGYRFAVRDSTGEDHIVKIDAKNRKELTELYCSCKAQRTCIHIRAAL